MKIVRKRKDRRELRKRRILTLSGKGAHVRPITRTLSIETNPELRGFAVHKELEVGGSMFAGNKPILKTGDFRRGKRKTE